MKTSKTIPAKEQRNPHQGGIADIDEIARLWIEVVFQQIQKRQSFSQKEVHKIKL